MRMQWLSESEGLAAMVGASAGARALRAFETEIAIGRIRDLDFKDSNRDNCWWMIAANPDVTLDVMKALPGKPWPASAGALKQNKSFSAGDIREFAEWCNTLPNACAGEKCGVIGDVYFSGKKDFSFADLERMAFAEGCRLDAPVFINSHRFLMMREVFGKENLNMTWALYERYFHRESSPLANRAVANARAIRDNPTFQWSFFCYELFQNPAIGAEALGELERLNPGLPYWNWERYSWSDAVTWEIVVKYWDKKWDISGLSRNPKVVDWARLSEWPRGLGKEPELEESRLWDWRALSANPAVATWKRVCETPDLPWWSEGLAINPAVCVWEAIAAPQLQSQYCLVWSRVQFVGETDRAEWARRWMAAWRIQRSWFPLYYTPDTAVWKRRMLRQLGDLQGGAAPAPPVAAAAS